MKRTIDLFDLNKRHASTKPDAILIIGSFIGVFKRDLFLFNN